MWDKATIAILACAGVCVLIVMYIAYLNSAAFNDLRPGWARKENVKGATGVDVHADVELRAAATVPSYGAASAATIHQQQRRQERGDVEGLAPPPPTYQRALEDRVAGS
ncbi:hypothetical protein BCR44DRAFT_37408, partial [Catenaria anguillulae PL171]